MKKHDFDKETLCPTNKNYNAKLILLDKTDHWDEETISSIESLIKTKKDSLDKYDRFIIRSIPLKTGKISCDLCNPGKNANRIYENSRRVALKYNNFFENPLDQCVSTMTPSSEHNNSPILKSLHEAVNKLSTEENINRIEVIIVSDLIEYDDLKFYTKYKKPSINDIKSRYSFSRISKKKLIGVEAIIIRRDKDVASMERSKKLFDEYFRSIGIPYNDMEFNMLQK